MTAARCIGCGMADCAQTPLCDLSQWETWIVLLDDGTSRKVYVANDAGSFIARAQGWIGRAGGATPRVAVARVIGEGDDGYGWSACRILAPGEAP